MVNIVRMTKDKGVVDFLDLVIAHVTKKENVKWLYVIDCINIFYTDQNEIEPSRAHRPAEVIEAKSN